VRLNVAGSHFLARQIVEGARSDVFVSADDAQMDVVERASRVVPGSRVALLTNQLVVVGAPGTALRVAGARDLTAPAVRRLALGNPESVPAGVYARRWLERAGVWSTVAPRVVPTLTVRAALAAVRGARADLAVVYITDTRTDPTVPVLFMVPRDEAPPISYPAALVMGRHQDQAARFLAFLQDAEAENVFRAAGFGIPGR
jgi:molybdate transport system substrate-binding protein